MTRNADEGLWSVRMRASKKTVGRRPEAVRLNPGPKIQNSKSCEKHISGAEGIYAESRIASAIKEYAARAMSHSRGLPDKIVISVERLILAPMTIPLLPVLTAQCISHEEAKKIICRLLLDSGISKKALQNSLHVITNKTAMRGASLISSKSGVRLEPDKERGVRVSMLGIKKNVERRLSKRLAEEGIDTSTVREALVLASKVASCKGIVAELCASDNPDYTTGYIATRELGYIRIPHIKETGSQGGGRVFFISEGSDTAQIFDYLEKTPVVAGKLSSIGGIITPDELLA